MLPIGPRTSCAQAGGPTCTQSVPGCRVLSPAARRRHHHPQWPALLSLVAPSAPLLLQLAWRPLAAVLALPHPRSCCGGALLVVAWLALLQVWGRCSWDVGQGPVNSNHMRTRLSPAPQNRANSNLLQCIIAIHHNAPGDSRTSACTIAMSHTCASLGSITSLVPTSKHL